MKGLATAGGLEYYHAEKFRKATRDVGSDTEIQARLLEADEFVPFADLEKKLRENGLLKEGQSFRESDKNSLRVAANEVLKDRVIANQQIEDRIVADSKRKLVQRLAKYISTGGIKGLNEEKWQQIEKVLREKTTNIRTNRALDEMVDYVKLYREGFDAGESRWNKWKMRYVYGAVETALWMTGASILWSKMGGVASGAEALGPEPVPQMSPQLDPMDKNLWNTIKGLGQKEFGINLTDQQLVELSKVAASNPNNGIGVNVWDIPGNPLDTSMKQGQLLDLAQVREMLATMSS